MTGVTVTHQFAASAERVYDAWLDPKKVRRFLYATATGEIVRCEVDARPTAPQPTTVPTVARPRTRPASSSTAERAPSTAASAARA